MSKRKAVKLSCFDEAVHATLALTPDEQIALMKFISAQLGGPRFYTNTEVEHFIVEAIQQYQAQQNQIILVPGRTQ